MEYADQLAALFTSNDDKGAFGIPKEKVVAEAVGYLPWRNAEFVFTSIRPFFDSEVFSKICKNLFSRSDVIIRAGGQKDRNFYAIKISNEKGYQIIKLVRN
jgi:hypothetical protein